MVWQLYARVCHLDDYRTGYCGHADALWHSDGMPDDLSSNATQGICHLGQSHVCPNSATYPISGSQHAHSACGSPTFKQRQQLGHHAGPDFDLSTRGPRFELPERSQLKVQLSTKDPSTCAPAPGGPVPIFQNEGPSAAACRHSIGADDWLGWTWGCWRNPALKIFQVNGIVS